MKNKKLDYFLNKICTIITCPISRDFKSENPSTYPQPIFHYFVGKILEIDDQGIFIQQWNNNKKLRSYFFINHIISICEEEILNPNDPEDAKVIEDFKKNTEKAMENAEKSYEKLKKQQEIIRKNPELDINSLINLSKKIKEE
jgi:hypothetical protein